MTSEESSATPPDSGGPKPVTLGLLAAPGLTHELARRVARDLPARLAERFPGTTWRLEVRVDPAAAASDEEDVDLVGLARERMLREGWTLAICLTDYPVHAGGHPVTAHASATHGVGLISVPALGPVDLEDRLRIVILRLVEGLLGERIDDGAGRREGARRRRVVRRVHELASPVGRAEVRSDRTIRFVGDVARGNVRLLLGMVRANRPWALIVGLSRALVGALGLDIFGVASPGIWLIADGQTLPRLVVIGIGSVLVICCSLIVVHGLWEHTRSRRVEVRERVVLFNLATALTVAIGVLTLFLVLFALNVATAEILIVPDVMHRQLGHPVGLSTYLALSATVTSLAMLGGALGAALERDRAVRAAAYGLRAHARTETARDG